jgi:hypothetical protein
VTLNKIKLKGVILDWNNISKSLKYFYEEHGKAGNISSEFSYLENAFLKTEALWKDQYDKMEQINTVLVSEAPLFGKDENYIYNLKTKPSSFFYFDDIGALPSVDILPKQPKSVEGKKEIMLTEFLKSGFLILDIFPFAFNGVDTSFNYRKLNKNQYTELLKLTVESYLIPKLNLCIKKSQIGTSFIYRYKALYEKTGHHFEQVLSEHYPDNSSYLLNTINGTNMSLDRQKLRSLFKGK